MTRILKSFFVFCALVTLSRSAHAVLGELHERSKTALLKASQVSIDEKNPCYSVQTIKYPNSTVKEFISTESNKVFKVSWMGAKHPDLQFLLGAHHRTFLASQNSKINARISRNHRMDSGRDANFSYQLSTSHRNQHGSATLPPLVPSCVADPGTLQ